MKLSTKSRVVKSNVVEVSFPRLVESQTGDFKFLSEHISVVRDTTTNQLGVENEDRVVHLSEQSKVSSPVKEWETEVSTLLNQAKEQAEGIIAKAQAEAQKIRKEAHAEVEDFQAQIRDEVSRQAYQEGFAQGSAQGFAEGKAQGLKETEKSRTEAQELIYLAQRAVEEEFSRVDYSLLHLAIKIAERILHSSLDLHPEFLLQRIRALTLLPQERQGWRLHVSPQDAEWLMVLPLGEQLDIPLLRDESLKPGECYLECLEGIFDARLEAQLDRFEQLLGEEIRHDGLDQAGR
jgi:flagellar assembly protein FliH